MMGAYLLVDGADDAHVEAIDGDVLLAVVRELVVEGRPGLVLGPTSLTQCGRH
jgi:hypothetical protein